MIKNWDQGLIEEKECWKGQTEGTMGCKGCRYRGTPHCRSPHIPKTGKSRDGRITYPISNHMEKAKTMPVDSVFAANPAPPPKPD